MIVCYQISHSDTLQPVQDKATWTVPGQTVSESITGEGSLTFTLEMYPDIGFSNRISAFPYVIDIGDEIFMMVRTFGTTITLLCLQIKEIRGILFLYIWNSKSYRLD